MVKKGWKALDLSTLPGGTWLAADPSISAFGMVLFNIRNGQVEILEATTLKTDPTPAGGWASNFSRGLRIEDQVFNVLEEWCDAYSIYSLATAVHEAPPAGGGTIMRPESTILGGFAFQSACSDLHIQMDDLVTPQAHKSLLCGNHIAKKQEHHNAIRNLLPQIFESRLITNEATRDALSIGLYAAHRSGQQKKA